MQGPALGEESGTSIERAARLGQQQREYGDVEYEEPAAEHVSTVRWACAVCI